jgi:hypothetical protein
VGRTKKSLDSPSAGGGKSRGRSLEWGEGGPVQCEICVVASIICRPLTSIRFAVRGGRCSTIAENRRGLYQEGVGSSRRLLAGVDEKASSSRVVDALTFCSFNGAAVT